ncbi:MAG: RusA family crossover junction endodeoxyribonuclease, partial [Candidatus Brocadiales bacterium]|nr:RusA family crossover junction endodeoxyribonuclease [Candidatus Bathyanammoxibius sp.]
MTEPITITLPELPPPLSACFNNSSKRGRVKSARYKAWIELCRLTCLSLRNCQPIHGLVVVHYLYARVRNQDGSFNQAKRDVFNYEKATSDLLVKMGVIDDDSLIQKGTVEWGGEAPVTITVTPFVEGIAA